MPLKDAGQDLMDKHLSLLTSHKDNQKGSPEDYVHQSTMPSHITFWSKTK